MPILDNKQVILSYGGGGSPLSVNITPTSLSGNQNSTLFTFTESGSDLSRVSKRVYVFDDESTSQTANPSYTFTKSGNKKVSAYFYSNDLTKVGYSEANLTVYQPSGYTCDLISSCNTCAALTKEASAYTGPLVRLLRESDWQTADIPYNSFDTLDTVSATTFLNLPVDDNLTGLPLDIMSPTKSLGYSTFRKIRTSYTGDCMTIRRSSDNATLNVGFGNDGYIVTSAITNFLTGSTTGYCTTLYNQGTLGSTGDFIQSTQINQPIVDVSSFSYPVLDLSNGSSYRFLSIRTQSNVTSNYTNIGKLNLFFKIKAKPSQTATQVIIPFAINAGSTYYYGTNSTILINNGFTYGTNGITHPTNNWVNWTLYTHRVRLDSNIYDLRYSAFGINNFDAQRGITSPLLSKTVTNTQTLGGLLLNYNTLVNSFQGWFSELLLDDTDLTHNQFYKIKKNVSITFENIPYSSETRTGLRVMRLYNQKSSTGEDYIQNSVSNMPEFRINDSLYNRPVIFSRNTYIGDVLTVEPRYGSMCLNVSSSTLYNSQHTLIGLYAPVSGNTNNGGFFGGTNNRASAIEYSTLLYHSTYGTSGRFVYYNYNATAAIIAGTNNNTIQGLTYPNYQDLKIDCYRQIVSTGATPQGLRTFTVGTAFTYSDTSTVAGAGCINTQRSLLFHRPGVGIDNSLFTLGAFRGYMFFEMNFGTIPTESNWRQLIYPLLRNKYGTKD